MLGSIVARTRERVRERQKQRPIDRVLAVAPTPAARRDFPRALSRPGRVNVIAEFKRRSPSKGVIRADAEPVRITQGYEIAGAAALSVLTEEDFFDGSLEDLKQARAATLLPTLRKDFIVDPYQVWESWIAGADAVLLIVAVLAQHELQALYGAAREAGLAALVEVHDERELEKAMALPAEMIGVNNRDLQTFEVSLETSLRLAPLISEGVVKVAESGIRNGEDIDRLRAAGYDAVLVGEHLMRSQDPGQALEQLIADAEADGGAAPGRDEANGHTERTEATEITENVRNSPGPVRRAGPTSVRAESSSSRLSEDAAADGADSGRQGAVRGEEESSS